MSLPAVGANPSGHARSFNRRLVLEAVRLEGPISRASVARATGLSIQTISNIADELMQAGLLHEVALPREGRGAPAAGLSLSPEGGFTFGISLDHRRLVIVLVDLSGRPRRQQAMDIEGLAPDEVLRHVKRRALAMARQEGAHKDRLWGAGVVMPMLFENGRPVAFGPTSMPQWQEVPIVERLSTALGIPVVAENDATAAAVGEQLHGAGRRLRDFFYIYVGAGVGGGMILSGHPYRGSAGRAGELGHIVVEPGGRPCACGNRGCLERYASLSAAQQALDGKPEGSRPVDPMRIAAAVDRLGPWLDVAASHLATACITIDNLLNPQAIVIGGIVPAALLDRLVDRLQQRLERTQLTGHGIRIVKPELGLETPALGGAALPLFNGLAPSASALQEPTAQRFRGSGR
jgi:predicted NBD/HSP70 family sugar kinase